MNNQQTNEAVAERLGLDREAVNGYHDEKCFCLICFRPATDKSDASMAINLYCDTHGLAWAMFRYKPKVVGVKIARTMAEILNGATQFYKDECTAICAEILEKRQ